MNPAGRLSLALITGLVLSLPVISACFHGDTDVLNAATRYLIAFVLAWAAIGGVARLFENYAASSVLDAEVLDDQPLRRADDEPSTAGAS